MKVSIHDFAAVCFTQRVPVQPGIMGDKKVINIDKGKVIEVKG